MSSINEISNSIIQGLSIQSSDGVFLGNETHLNELLYCDCSIHWLTISQIHYHNRKKNNQQKNVYKITSLQNSSDEAVKP